MNKKVIITGKNGYIANALKKWFESKKENMEVVLLDLRNPDWINTSFENVQTVIHTAALVHKKESKYSDEEYQQVNTELTRVLAQKSKDSGVNQFIFMSTMAVYGARSSCFRKMEINHTTPLLPYTKYGISKLAAEKSLEAMANNQFLLAIIRPPFVYGKGCPGNYNTLKKLTLKIRIIPRIQNQKSMIYIDDLCELVYQVYQNKRNGIFCPQNSEIQSTYKISELIAKYNNKPAIASSFFTPFVFFASLFVGKIRKAFGNEFYALDFSNQTDFNYHVTSFEDSIKRTEEA